MTETLYDKKTILKQFLDEKSEFYPQIIFVYMEFSDKEYNESNRLNIFPLRVSEYPLLYHIIDGNNILVAVTQVDNESLNESFDSVKHIYD